MMNKLLTLLRLPALLLGVAVLFITDRYLGTESYHLALRVVAVVLLLISLASTAALSGLAGRQGYTSEASGWRFLCIWQVVIAGAIGAYLGYVKLLGNATVPESPASKALLATWLVLFTLGAFAGIGGEWAMHGAGRGQAAEPLRVRRSSAAWLAVGLLLAFLVTLNFVGDKKDIQRDWSYLKVRTPSESTRNMLKTLTGDLTIALFYPPGNEVRTTISDYFNALASGDPHIKLEWYDKDMAPTKAEEYRVAKNGQIVLDMKGKKSRIDTGTSLGKAKKTLKELDSEFQKAFLETTSERKTLYFTRGHGEASWVGDSADNPLRGLRMLESFLKQQNYSTRLFGITEGSATAVPDDAAAVVIIGPSEPFQKSEVDAIRAYLERGGNLMVFLGLDKSTGNALIPAAGDSQPLYELLDGIGLHFNSVPLANEHHVVATHSDADAWFIYTNVFTSHESVSSLARHDERVGVLMYQSGYFTVLPSHDKWKTTETVRALSDTFADVNRNFKFDQGEKRDAYILGATAELKDVPGAKDKRPDDPAKKSHQGRVVAFADANVLSDALVRNIGNILYLSDSLKWLIGESELQGKLADEEDVKIRHTSKEDVFWFHGTVVAVPLLVLVVGFIATRRRPRDGKEPDGKKDKEEGKPDAA